MIVCIYEFWRKKCAIFGVSSGHLRGEVVRKNHVTKVQKKSDIRKIFGVFFYIFYSLYLLKKEKQQSLTIRQAIVDIFLITVSLLTSCSFLEGDSIGFAIECKEVLPLGL